MTKIRKDLKNTYNKISSHFDATRKNTWEPVEHFIKEHPKDTLILDLAAGTGRHSIYAKNHDLYPIAGDFSISQLKELEKKDRTIPKILLDLTALPFKDNTFDSIICIAAIHHLDTEKNRIKSLTDAHRILKTESRMLTTAWALDQPRFIDKTKDGDIHYTWDKQHPRFYHLFKDNELKELAKKSHIEILESFREKDNIYLISCTKNMIIGTRIR